MATMLPEQADDFFDFPLRRYRENAMELPSRFLGANQ
jgi:hypothetical protein